MLHGLCFSLVFFVFQLTEFTVNDRADILLGPDMVNTVYSVGIAFTALGFLLFPLLQKMFKSSKIRTSIIFVTGIVSILTTVMLLTTESETAFLIGSFIALLSFGYIGGNVYYRSAIGLAGNPHTGAVIGIGMGAAVLLQFVMQNLIVNNYVLIASVVISVGIVVCFSSKTLNNAQTASLTDCHGENHTDKKKAAIIIIATILMSFVLALIDGVVVQKHAIGALSVSSYSRLFYAASLTLAGLIADIKNRKFLSLATVCMLFVSTISTALMSSSDTFFWATAFMYLYSGFYVMFFTLSFLDFAPTTKAPAFWAGFGRVIRSVVAAITAISTIWMFEMYGTVSLIVGSCILSVLTLLVLIGQISRSVFPLKADLMATSDMPKSPTSREKIQSYCEHYGFTPRECEVFEKLITTEDGVQEIADGMFVSRRVLQRHISSIYAKTGTKSRVGLLRNFSDFTG